MSLPKLYNSWFCPFAQRAWIAFIEKGIDFEYIEQDPYNKTSEWLAVNPRGLVPAIVHNDKTVYESGVCIEYLEDAWPEARKLLPSDPYDKAFVRMWCDFISKKFIAPWYAILIKRTQEERNEAAKGILSSLKEIFDSARDDGPFFLGKEFGMFDIMLAPHVQRFCVLKHYRGFVVPQNDEYARFHAWWKSVQEVESFKKTAQPEDKLIENYNRYATDTTKSLVAQAIRGNTTLP